MNQGPRPRKRRAKHGRWVDGRYHVCGICGARMENGIGGAWLCSEIDKHIRAEDLLTRPFAPEEL